MNEEIEWARFWGEGVTEFAFDLSGFLTDPNSEYFPQNSALRTLDSLEEAPCVILLGEMGIGKTSEIKRHHRILQERGLRSIWFNLAEYDANTLEEIFTDPAIGAWESSGNGLLYLLLDSFDEALMSMQTLGDRLCRRLTTWDLSRLRLRVVCRSAIWPSTTEEKLRGMLPTVVVTLAPLRYDDVLQAAGVWGVSDAETFIEAVQAAGAVAFAMKPGTLRFLAKEYVAKGQLPPTETQLYDAGCRLLCTAPTERTDRRHEGDLTADQRVAIAGRIAALMLCGGKSHLCDMTVDHDLRDTDLSFDTVLRGLELIQAGGAPLMRGHITEVAFSGLFRPSGPHRVCWSHYSYAEHLAAKYMSSALSTQQILTLLLHPAGSRAVIPQLSGLAARLAVTDAEVFQGLVAENADMLLEADGRSFNVDQRAALTDSLLQSLSAGKLRVRWERLRRYHLLCHKSLSTQLRPYLKSGGFQVRIAAIAIAGSCKRAELGHLLLKIALDSGEEISIRAEAAQAVFDIGDKRRIRQLRPLIVDVSLDDERSNLKGIAMQHLWETRVIGVAEVFSNLSPVNPVFHGTYARFVLDLPDSLTPADLPAALLWIDSQPGWADQDHSFQVLTDRILAKVVEHAHDPATMRLLIEAIRSRIQKNRLTGWTHGESTLKQAIRLGTEPLRHELIETFARHLISSDFNGRILSFTIRDFIDQILSATDFHWVLTKCIAEPEGLKKLFFAYSARVAWDCSDPTAYQAALEAHGSDPYVADAFAGDFGYTLLDSDAARRGRELVAVPQQSVLQDRMKIDTDIDELLDQVEVGLREVWWRIALVLIWSTPKSGQSEWADDIRTLPGWELASPRRRRRLLDAAQSYLLGGPQTGDDWTRSDTKRPAAAAYRALLLLQNERPEFVQCIPAATVTSWAWAVLSYPTIGLTDKMRDADKAITQRVMSADPAAAEKVLKKLLEEPEQRQHLRDIIRRLDGSEFTGLNEFFETILVAYDWPTAHLEPLMLRLISGGSGKARSFAEGILRQPLNPKGAVERSLAAARVLLKSAPEYYWPKLWLRGKSSVPFATGLVAQLTGWLKPNVSLMGSLSEEQLVQVYLWLAKHHPGSGHRGPLGAGPMGIVQYSIPGHLASRGTAQAVASLARIIGRVGKTVELDHYLAEAKERVLYSTWTPADVDSVIQMLMDRKKRYVGTPEQLAAVVMEALSAIQAELQGTPPTAPLLWDKWEVCGKVRGLKKTSRNDSGKRPKDEESLSDFIAVALRNRIQHRNIVVNREVQIRRGQETDIHIEALPQHLITAEAPVPRVIVEVKGCWNKHLKTDIEHQLVSRYLERTPHSAGVYLVGWFICSKWREPSAATRRRQVPAWSIEKARAYFEEKASQLAQAGRFVGAVVLDIGLHT